MRSPRSDAYSVCTPANADGLSLLHDLLDRLRDDHPEIAPTDRLSFRTAVAELFANIIEHGNVSEECWVEFIAGVSAAGLDGWIEARGEPVLAGVPSSVPIDAERGRGLFMASRLCGVVYRHTDGMNTWWIHRDATVECMAQDSNSSR